MSPEQARAEDVDTRTDLFSLGLLLYEMATGMQAFSGPSAAVVYDAILNRDPSPASEVNPSVPFDLERSIDKSLEKERRFRYQYASELRSDLERLRRDISFGRQRPPVRDVRVVTPQPQSQPQIQPQFQPQIQPAPQPQPPPWPAAEPRSRNLKRVFLLGLIPGVGALYNGEYKKAAIHLGIFVLLTMLEDAFPRYLSNSLGWIRMGFVLYMAFDAYHTAQKRTS
jgi:serine/threonine protein kinase